MSEHSWLHKPGLFSEAEIPPGVPVEREPPENSSGIFHHRFCIAHSGEEAVQEIPDRVFN